MRKAETLVAAIVVLSVVAGCKSEGRTAGDSIAAASASPLATTDHTADKAMIIAADSAWMRHVMAKNVDSLMTYYTDDAVSYGFGAPAVGSDKIRALYTEMVKSTISDPKLNSGNVTFSDDGSMALDHGTYSMTMTPPGGKPSAERGAFLNVWKKADGRWKMVAEISSPLPKE